MSDYIIPFGKKYKGKKVTEIPYADLQNYIEWLEKSDIKPDSYMDKQLKAIKVAFAALQPVAQPQEPVPTEPAVGKVSGRKITTKPNDPYKGKNANGNVFRIHFTDGGKELPLMNLRGKEYLEVKWRLVWFREDHPDWSIETELMSVTDVSAYAKATVKNESGRIIATSHKFESIQGFPDYIEKAETGAIGRALALIGYGTQFCADDLDEGERQVDDGVGKNKNPSEPLVPTVEKGDVVAVTISGRDKDLEKLLGKLGFTYDWVSGRHLAYKDRTVVKTLDEADIVYDLLTKGSAS